MAVAEEKGGCRLAILENIDDRALAARVNQFLILLELSPGSTAVMRNGRGAVRGRKPDRPDIDHKLSVG